MPFVIDWSSIFMFFKAPKTVEEPDPLLSMVPDQSRVDDIYLVSYPKSGVTWISFLIANLIIKKLSLDIEANFFNIHGFVPDIHQGTDIPFDMGFFPFKRIIKSHSQYNPSYKNVLYVLRDPRSVMVSYHQHLKSLMGYEGSLSELINDPTYGIEPWVKHLSGWMDGINPSIRFRILRYEDFKKDCHNELSRLALLLGFNLEEEMIEQIVDNCSFDNMRKLEEDSRSISFVRYDKNFRFVRRGSSSSWKEELKDSDVQRIESTASDLMKEFGYL